MNAHQVDFLQFPVEQIDRSETGLASTEITTAPLALAVLVLEAEYRLTGAVLFCLSQRPGLKVHLLTRNALSPYRFSSYVQSCHTFAADQPAAAFANFAREVAHTTGAQIFLPIDVAGMRFAMAHRSALEPTLRLLPLPAAADYETAADKGLLAVFMQEHGIPAPPTLVDIEHDLAAKLAGFAFPVLLKPIEGAGGRGIVRYHNAAALRLAVAELPAGSRYIIQTCLKGYDIDCNVLYQNGQLVAHSIQKGLVSGSGEFEPCEAIEFVRDDAVLAVADRLMRALRWNGVAHLDLRYDADDHQVKVIEINTRFWLTVVGSALAAKVNFPALACLAAAGHPVAQGPAALGRYIPFTSFLRYRFARRSQQLTAPALAFAWRETSVRVFLGNPLTKLYRWFKAA